MGLTIRAHWDGKVFVPDEPVDWPVDQPLEVELRPLTMDQQTWASLSIEERLRRVRAAAGRIAGPSIPDEALRRENLYEERI
ncbi:MAG: hypothetical protein GX774_03810 [Armatimonadetes bacterium]|jgi:hypothetical protein|nr:hypothetical protein [Armatimonadota bacterium]